MKSALSLKLANDKLIVVDEMTFDQIKTKQMVAVLKALEVNTSVLLVMEAKNINVEKSSANIPGVRTALTNTINVLDLLKYDRTILTKAAAMKIQEVYV